MSRKQTNLFGKVKIIRDKLTPLERKKRSVIAYYCEKKNIRLTFKRYVKAAKYLCEHWRVDTIKFVIDWLAERGELMSMEKVESTLERFYKHEKNILR